LPLNGRAGPRAPGADGPPDTPPTRSPATRSCSAEAQVNPPFRVSEPDTLRCPASADRSHGYTRIASLRAHESAHLPPDSRQRHGRTAQRSSWADESISVDVSPTRSFATSPAPTLRPISKIRLEKAHWTQHPVLPA
jgi:hypothetical protein